MLQELYPLIFQPIYKEKIWGGRLFETILDRDLPEGLIGESWDTAAHEHGTSVVLNGPLTGQDLEHLVKIYGEALLGPGGMNPEDKFPLLLKLIDANQDLSVQVHPDDAYVRRHTSETWGKTEMWYIIHSEPGAWIIWGLRPGVTKDQFAKAIEAGGEEILACLNKVPVKPGELYPISAGLVHALGAGVVVAEIQQNSDTTYRVYDWDRLDASGVPRDLHVKEALDVIDFSGAVLEREYQLGRAAEHFVMNVLQEPEGLSLDLGQAFQILTILEAPAEIVWNGKVTSLLPGQSCLLPASLGHIILNAQGVVLQSTLPER